MPAHRVTEQDNVRETFARNLKRLMYADGLSQKDLSEKINAAPSTVSAWCNGDKLPRMETIQQLADLFDVDKSDLLFIGSLKKQDPIPDMDPQTLPSRVITYEDLSLAQEIARLDERQKQLMKMILEFLKNENSR